MVANPIRQHLPSVQLNGEQIRVISNGGSIPDITIEPTTTGDIAAVGGDGQLVAILKQRNGGRLAPVRVLATV